MARRKGKSQRRIRDWARRLHAGEEPEDLVARQQRLPPPEVKLGQGAFAAGQEDQQGSQVQGMLVGFFPGGAVVRAGGTDLLCGIAKTFRPPEQGAGSSPLAVGDAVTVALAPAAPAADRDRADGMILARRLRGTVLARPRPMRHKRIDEHETEALEKVIAANMDLLLIVASTRLPPLRPGLIDRFLIVAERGGLAGVLAVNKIDLARPEPDVLAELKRRGVEVLCCSAATGEGLEDLRRRLAGHKSVLAGASGVGKSTLVNALVPGADAATREVRAKDQRGRHTTSATVVYELPCGGCLVDTPGVRELGLRIDRAELPWYFPEFEPLSPRCRFADCTHTHEPACAVQAAVEAGQVRPERYESYLRLLETIDER